MIKVLVRIFWSLGLFSALSCSTPLKNRKVAADFGCDPNKFEFCEDRDADTLYNGFEQLLLALGILQSHSPTANNDCDRDGIPDGKEIFNGKSLLSWQGEWTRRDCSSELRFCPDSDQDGLSNGFEKFLLEFGIKQPFGNNSDPHLSKDSDGDGVPDSKETYNGWSLFSLHELWKGYTAH